MADPGKRVTMPAGQIVHCKVTLPSGTTFEDTATFGITVQTVGSAPDVDTADVTAAITTFFNDAAVGATGPVGTYMGNGISRATNAISISFTDVTADLSGLPAGTPFLTTAFTLIAADSPVDIPPQCAALVAMRSAYGVGLEQGPSAAIPTTHRAIEEGAPATHTGITRPRARDRGRFYLGPLNDLANKTHFTGPSGDAGALSAFFLTDLGLAANVLLSAHNPGSANEWHAVVWSRRNAAVTPVAFYAIDQGFATIRKRIDTTLTRVLAWAPTSSI
jgi:hypothetical protein